MTIKLIADSGSTKTEWCLLAGEKKIICHTQGLSPYFLSAEQIAHIIESELKPKIIGHIPAEIFFYGTGCSNKENIRLVRTAITKVFSGSEIHINHDLLGAARSLFGPEKGVACILGTGSNSCFYNGKRITNNIPGLGYILGDEGSGTYLGKKVVQYFLYRTFDADLMDRFMAKFNTSNDEILEAVYKKPLPNRYLASYAIFLAENRGHYMIENIIEDGFNDFFFNHLYKYRETWKYPIHFTGSIAYGFKDVLQEMCKTFELTLGKVTKKPLDGLIKFHR